MQVMLVITLLAYGCPPQIVQAFGYDERTVKEWWRRSGEHCRRVHEHMVETQQLDLQQVQTDEIKAKVQRWECLDGHGADGAHGCGWAVSSARA